MKKGAPCAAGAINDLFVEKEEIVGIVVILFADHVDESGPTVTNANHLITFAERAKCDAADGWIETGNVATSSENADHASLGVDVSHNSRIALSWDAEQEIILFGRAFRKSEGGICLSSIILSPLNSNVKMSPYETGDIHVESEGTATRGCNFPLCEGGPGVCQSRRTARSIAATGATPQSALSARR